MKLGLEVGLGPGNIVLDGDPAPPPEKRGTYCHKNYNWKCGPMPNVMATLPNTGGALCSTPQFRWRPLVESRAVTLPRREIR